jgi:hypothetical protein
LEISDLTQAQRHRVASTWAGRACAEISAHRRFGRLARTLRSEDAPAALVQLAAKATDDETRHAEQCLVVAQAYGWTAPLDKGPPDTPLGLGSLPPRDRTLAEVVGFCCVQETLNTSLLMATMEHAQAPVIRETVGAILADELHHARLGWGYLAWSAQAGRGGFLAALLPSMVAELGAEVLHGPAEPPGDVARLKLHGELDRGTRREIFQATMADVVWPGLEGQGVDVRAGVAAMADWASGALGG